MLKMDSDTAPDLEASAWITYLHVAFRIAVHWDETVVDKERLKTSRQVCSEQGEGLPETCPKPVHHGWLSVAQSGPFISFWR